MHARHTLALGVLTAALSTARPARATPSDRDYLQLRDAIAKLVPRIDRAVARCARGLAPDRAVDVAFTLGATGAVAGVTVSDRALLACAWPALKGLEARYSGPRARVAYVLRPDPAALTGRVAVRAVSDAVRVGERVPGVLVENRSDLPLELRTVGATAWIAVREVREGVAQRAPPAHLPARLEPLPPRDRVQVGDRAQDPSTGYVPPLRFERPGRYQLGVEVFATDVATATIEDRSYRFCLRRRSAVVWSSPVQVVAR